MHQTDLRKILIIGEGSDSSELSSMLSRQEYRCSVFPSHRDALRQIALSVPDAVILIYPDLSSEISDFLSVIKKSVRTRMTPVLMLGSGNPEERLVALEMGFDAYIDRSAGNKELVATILSKLSRYREFYMLTVTDELTKLFNRRELMNRMDELMNEKIPLISVVIIDIDYFKKINDIYGHQTGDVVLARFSALLNSRYTDSFIPARFGGEEFVVLMPGVGSDDAKIKIDALRTDLDGIQFEATDTDLKFNVSFSAGVSEYPKMADGISTLLSRADQALYAAKREGRARTYIFRSIMARDDRFWDQFHERFKGTFITSTGVESIMELPFLPETLEKMIHLPYSIESIGVISLHIAPLFRLVSHGGYRNYYYDLESICRIVFSACESHLPTDMLMSVGDPCENDIVVLYPSVEDFHINEDKFLGVYKSIMRDLSFSLINFNVTIRSSCGVVLYQSLYPRRLYSRIGAIRRKKILISESKIVYDSIFRRVQKDALNKKSRLRNSISTEYVYEKNGTEAYTYFVLRDYKVKQGLFEILCIEKLRQTASVELFLSRLINEFKIDLRGRLVIPWTPSVGLATFVKMISRVAGSIPVCISIDEVLMSGIDPAILASIHETFPENIELCITNCFIGSTLLNYLSVVDVEAIFLSPNIVRDIHMYRDRLKIIIGVKQFADQIGVKIAAMGVGLREEYDVLSSIGIKLTSGHYLPDRVERQD